MESFISHQGLGVSGVTGGHAVAAGQTAVYVGWDGQVRGVLVVADTVKPTSAEAVTRLRGLGLRPVLLTGDNPRAARAVAAQVGIDEVIAGVLPAGKVNAVKRLQDEGRVVAMAGACNIAAIPPAALGFLNPLISGAAMAFSLVFVVSNSLRLRRFQPGISEPHRA